MSAGGSTKEGGLDRRPGAESPTPARAEEVASTCVWEVSLKLCSDEFNAYCNPLCRRCRLAPTPSSSPLLSDALDRLGSAKGLVRSSTFLEDKSRIFGIRRSPDENPPAPKTSSVGRARHGALNKAPPPRHQSSSPLGVQLPKLPQEKEFEAEVRPLPSPNQYMEAGGNST